MTLDYRHANEILILKNKNVLWLGDFTAAEDINWIREKNIRTGKALFIKLLQLLLASM